MVSKLMKTEKPHTIQVKKEIELMYIDGSPYVANLKTNKIFSLNEVAANVLKSIMECSELKDLAEYLHKDYGLEKNAAFSFVKNALKVLEKKGFLEVGAEKASTFRRTRSVIHRR